MPRRVPAAIVLGSSLTAVGACSLAQLDARYDDDASPGASAEGGLASPGGDGGADGCAPGSVCFVGIGEVESDAGVIVVSSPPGAKAGDLLVLVLFEDNVMDAGDASPFAAAGAGWVNDFDLVLPELDANARFHTFFDGAVDASFTFTSVFSTPCHALVAAYRGVSQEEGGVGRPYVAPQTQVTSSENGLASFALPTPARSMPGARLVFGLADSQAGSWMSTTVTIRGGDHGDAGPYVADAGHIVIADVASPDGGTLSVVRGGTAMAPADVTSLLLSP